MIKKEFNPVSGLYLYSVFCDGDGCDVALPPRGAGGIAVLDAVVAGWRMRIPERKFSGTALTDYCPKCRKKEDVLR